MSKYENLSMKEANSRGKFEPLSWMRQCDPMHICGEKY